MVRASDTLGEHFLELPIELNIRLLIRLVFAAGVPATELSQVVN